MIDVGILCKKQAGSSEDGTLVALVAEKAKNVADGVLDRVREKLGY